MSALREAEDREARARVLRKAEIYFADRWRTVVIRDISASGCQLRSDLKFPIGQDLALNFQGGLQVMSTVRWHRDRYYGLSFEPVLAGDVVKVLHTRGKIAAKKDLNRSWTDSSGYNQLRTNFDDE